MPPIRITSTRPQGREIVDLHTGLERLNLAIDPTERASGEIGATTRAAIVDLQHTAGLPETGRLNAATVTRINQELEHRYFIGSKTRAAKIQDLLARTGNPVDAAEAKNRTFGESTSKALGAYLEGAGLPKDTLLTPEIVGRLEGDALAARLATKTQVGNVQRTLLQAVRIAKLDIQIDPTELKNKKLGDTSRAAIRAFQEKYGLTETGDLDPLTLKRMETVATSRAKPKPLLRTKDAQALAPVTRNLRLNMTNKHVGTLQQSLAFLGFPIDEKEFKASNFGATTREAVIAFQKRNWLPVTGHIEGETTKLLNQQIAIANPQAIATAHTNRLRGSVRDDLWRGRAGVKVQVFEKLIRGTGALLGERPTTSSGFYDIPYNPPQDPNTKQPLSTFHVVVKVVDAANAELDSKVLFNPTLIAWVNFVAGDQPYRGNSEFETRFKSIQPTLGGLTLLDLEETDASQEITHVSVNSGLTVDDVMRLVISARVAAEINAVPIDAAAVYAWVRQNMPPALPSDLLLSTQQWVLIDQVTERVASGLVFLDPVLQEQAFDNAIKENYIPVSTGLQKSAILAALATTRDTFILEKPILVGDGSLKALLDASIIDPGDYSTVTSSFLQHKTLGADFFADARTHPADFGGTAAIDDFETTVSLGEITKNFAPLATNLKSIIEDNANTLANAPRDFAKLDHAGWVTVVNANGGQVPPGTDGNGAGAVANYAATLAAQAERLYPTVAFVAESARSTTSALTKTVEIQQFVDAQPTFDLRSSNIDAYVATNNLNLDDDVLGEVKVLQRVQRITPTAALGRTLIEQGIHSAFQALAMGKEGLVRSLTTAGVDKKVALTVYGSAEFQYAGALNRLVDFRAELNRVAPAAIVPYTYTPEELNAFSGGVPNLEALFGSADVCDCADCVSVLGPPAWIADVFRFLDAQPSEVAGKSVLDILFERRPDLGNIKLNCDNTNVSLPYIDLVNEVLEALVSPANANTSFQTTLSQAELRAYPEHVRAEAYDLLKVADFPMHNSLNLWQEEARVLLGHLGVPRHELMRLFQASSTPPLPTDTSIAGEYIGISTHEVDLIVTAKTAVADQKIYWGLDPLPTTIPVADFLERSKLEYGELLRLLYVEWLNPVAGPNRMVIQRPVETCSLSEQTLINLTPTRFDQMHRFLRLWRHVPWQMWELDLLLRAARIGGGTLDATALTRLAQVRQLQERLNLDVPTVLAMVGEIPADNREVPEDPQKAIRSYYGDLFQNRLITNPIDPDLALPIAANLNLSDHRPALVAALAVADIDLTSLLGRTDGKLTLANLSTLVGYSALAQGLDLRPPDLVTLLKLAGVADPFASVQQTLDVIDQAEAIAASGIAVAELDFLLNARPSSPYGLRDEVVAQALGEIRESLRSNPAADARGQIITGVASALALTDEQASVLLDKLQVGGTPVIDLFLNPALTATDAAGTYLNALDKATFTDLFTSYRLLHKASIVVTRHNLTDPGELAWIIANGAAVGALSLNDLPVNVAPPQPRFPRWLALHRFVELRDAYPAPEGASLVTVLDLARNAGSAGNDVLGALAALTGWDLNDLQTLHTKLGFKHGATSSYKDVATYRRLRDCFGAMRRIGVGAAQPVAWANRDSDTSGAQQIAAQQIRQAAKARYTSNAWLTVVSPLMDELREKKRDGLTAWLVEQSLRTEPKDITVNGKQWANPKRWKDPTDLLGWVLIDVEMSSCQLTSRTKQAISSTQMFVQRCFLNLEQAVVQVSRDELADTVSLNSWKQWKWMKNYRIWEANRKVFLYPENWIEPALRDDKSPFFEELESELLQKEITDTTAEEAYRHYLEKVHEVARLEITGVYYEVDDDNPYDTLPPNINRLHVVGRTKADPAVYYYRQFDLSYGTWTAWEQIEVEIAGDQVIPVIYNRQLYLFWLVFTEKPQKVRKQPAAQASSTPQDAPDPSNQLEIQLAWSARKDDGWTAKKLSRQKIIHPWQRPLHSYNLKPRYRMLENLLWLDIYISTSEEFNNRAFTDPYTGQAKYLTATRYDEAGRPWHSSSFAFDGAVVGTRMKGLTGFYRLRNNYGVVSNDLSLTDSHTWVNTTFGPDGSAIVKAQGGRETMPRQVLPAAMHFSATRLRNNRTNPNTLNVLETGASVSLLRGAVAPFDLVFSQHGLQFDEAATFPPPMIYQDPQRSFFIKPAWQTVLMGYNTTLQRLQYEFRPFYHPYTALFLRELKRSGLDGLLNRRIQVIPRSYYPGNNFGFGTYAPQGQVVVHQTAQTEIVDFDLGGAYSIYNWETFFHAPLMVAVKLTQNQRFEEAMRWFHFIFDPTNTESLPSPQRFWVTRPFYEQNSDDYRKQRIENLLKDIGANEDQLRAWKNNPFKPHLIARYRPVAYQKTVVMKYIDNLISWGDQLFRRDTIESINEATTLYMLAYEILGRRPIKVPNVARADKSYNELAAAGALDPFGNQKVEILMENLTDSPIQVIRTNDGAEPMPVLQVSYFGIPQNNDLLAYWDLVADRLYKIRNCMNIRGIVRQLPLFEPPIDPAILVQAAAAGVDLDTVLSAAGTPASQYRSRVLIQKSLEFTADVRALGERLLSVVEKIDADGLERLRSSNEVALLDTVTAVRTLQVRETEFNITAAEQQQAISQAKIDYYGGRDYINLWEGTALTLSGISALAQTAIALGYALAGGLTFIPRFTVGASGFGGSPVAAADPVDGAKVSKAAEYAVSTLGAIATAAEKWAGMATTMGSYQRRSEEWTFQKDVATIEVSQTDALIAAAKLRRDIAQQELDNHEVQREQARALEDYLKTKYTNGQLYDWMLGQASTVYFQCYQLAFDMAKRAEQVMKYELGDEKLSFIQFGYWDGLKKGLLAGERLTNDLRRMESAWYEQDTRSFEITKNVSLAQVDPLALLTLKTTGTCQVTLPEWLFDLDYPGHYRRRLTAVSISIPCVVGPYTSVNCTLSLTDNGVRVRDGVAGGYGDPLLAPDDRFVKETAPVTSIATSHAQNDAGLFELNFNDERFLPFEGAGAVSKWTIDLPIANNQFDFATISDVVLHIRYNAEPGSTALADAARTNLATIVPKAGARLFVLNHEFGTEWQRFLSPQPNTDQVLTFALEKRHLPFRARAAKTVKVTRLELVVESDWANGYVAELTLPGQAPLANQPMTRVGGADKPHRLILDPVTPPANLLGQVSVKIRRDNVNDFRSLTADEIKEAYLIVAFTTT